MISRFARGTLPARPIFQSPLTLALAAVLVFILPRMRNRTPAGIESLAVLPLANLSGDPAQDYFADGITEALITDLARLGGLRVTSRTSIARYKGTNRSLPEIARELKVDAIVEGSIARSGQRVRVSAQLIDARADRNIWADTYDRSLEDVFALQRDVARSIVRVGRGLLRVSVDDVVDFFRIDGCTL